ncbi:MAG: hypothetical protein ACI9VR_002278, partial [Cognaticolwellia sp.]
QYTVLVRTLERGQPLYTAAAAPTLGSCP